MAKVVELQTQVLAMGIPAFAAACAAQDGETIPQLSWTASTSRPCSRAWRKSPPSR